MRRSRTLVGLALLIAVLAAVAAGIGLFWQTEGTPEIFTTLRGETVTLYGRGLYRYDSLFAGAGYRGQDAVTLFVSVPLLIITALFYRRGSLRGGLLLTATLASFLYVYASMALGAAYNSLFLLYVVLFSASFFAFVLAIRAIDLTALASRFRQGMPRRGPAALLFVSGAITLFVWLSPLVTAMLQGRPPDLLAASSTMVTDALDLAIITPATIIAGALILRRSPLGYVVALALLGIIVILVPTIAATTVSQTSAGVSFSPGEIIGPISGFAILGLLAIWAVVAILRHIGETPRPRARGRTSRSRTAHRAR